MHLYGLFCMAEASIIRKANQSTTDLIDTLPLMLCDVPRGVTYTKRLQILIHKVYHN